MPGGKSVTRMVQRQMHMTAALLGLRRNGREVHALRLPADLSRDDYVG